MVRSNLALVLLLLFPGPVMAAATSIGGGGLGYSCSSRAPPDQGTPTCTCEGYFDCLSMIEDGVCKGKIYACGLPKDGKQTCSCDWKVNLAPLPGKSAPDLQMRTR